MIFSLRFSLSHICLLDCILLLADPLFLNSSLPCPFQVAPALTETSSHLWCEYSWWWWCNWKLFSGTSSSSPPRSWSPPWRQHLCPSTCQNWPPQSCLARSPSNLESQAFTKSSWIFKIVKYVNVLPQLNWDITNWSCLLNVNIAMKSLKVHGFLLGFCLLISQRFSWTSSPMSLANLGSTW